MMPVIGILRIMGELGLQQGQVAPVFVRLRSVIADMVQVQIHIGDPQTPRLVQMLDVGYHLFMNDPAESDVRIVQEQAVFAIEGESLYRPQPEARGDKILAGKQALHPFAADRRQALVGIDIENPAPARRIQADVAGSREITGPGKVDQPGAVGLRYLAAAIGRTGVDDDDFIDDRGNGRKTGVKDALFVPDDERSGKEWTSGLLCDRGNPRPRGS